MSWAFLPHNWAFCSRRSSGPIPFCCLSAAGLSTALMSIACWRWAFYVWSLATAATGLVHGFAMLLAMRLLLGIGESVAFPCYSKILAQHLPEHRRGFANGAIIAGMKCGPVVGTLGAGLLMAKYGWRPVFIGIGLLSLVWLPAWMKWMPRSAASAHSGSLPACDRHLPAALILGHCRRRLLSCLPALFHDHVASFLPCP